MGELTIRIVFLPLLYGQPVVIGQLSDCSCMFLWCMLAHVHSLCHKPVICRSWVCSLRGLLTLNEFYTFNSIHFNERSTKLLTTLGFILLIRFKNQFKKLFKFFIEYFFSFRAFSTRIYDNAINIQSFKLFVELQTSFLYNNNCLNKSSFKYSLDLLSNCTF